MITEYFAGQTLTEYSRKFIEGKVPEEHVKSIIRQISKGLLYCHKRGIAHRDLKHDNILIDSQMRIKIIDFGYAIEMQPGALSRPECGSPNYMPPEIVRRQNYDPFAADIWSLGVILYKLIKGKLPFSGSTNHELAKAINSCLFEPIYPKDCTLNF